MDWEIYINLFLIFRNARDSLFIYYSIKVIFYCKFFIGRYNSIRSGFIVKIIIIILIIFPLIENNKDKIIISSNRDILKANKV